MLWQIESIYSVIISIFPYASLSISWAFSLASSTYLICLDTSSWLSMTYFYNRSFSFVFKVSCVLRWSWSSVNIRFSSYIATRSFSSSWISLFAVSWRFFNVALKSFFSTSIYSLNLSIYSFIFTSLTFYDSLILITSSYSFLSWSTSLLLSSSLVSSFSEIWPISLYSSFCFSWASIWTFCSY